MESKTGKIMPKSLITLLIALFLAGPAWPQEVEAGADAAPSADETEVPEVREAEPADEAPQIDDTGLDEQGYEEDEDDFVPSEEIPADQPIPFPSNI
jgi:hypothetical protein